MHLLDDVHLIESEVLALPTASTFKRSITKLASYEHNDSWKKFYSSSWKYDQKPSLEESRGKIADFFGETRFEVEVKSPVEDCSVEYSRSHAAGYLKIGRWTNLAMQSMDNSRSNSEYYCCLYWAYALKQYLTTGRKYALNKDMRLLTRLTVYV